MFDLIPFEHRNNDLFRYFDDMERAFFGGNTDIAPCKTDILDEGNRFVLKADLPGFKKEDVSAKLENGYLTITAAKGLDKDEKNDKGVYIRRERYSGQCARTFYVGEAVTQEDIKAKFEDGILKVTIPKVEPKKVEDKKYIAIEG